MLTWNEKTYQEFLDKGYVHIGNIANSELFKRLENKINDIMLGKEKLDYDKVLMQLDSEEGVYGNAGAQ